jgi:hypothetical protein
MRAAQGFGLQVDASQIGTPAFEAAIMQVLEDPKYSQAAKVASVRLRARKRTPVQEAAGEVARPPSSFTVTYNSVLSLLPFDTPSHGHADWIEHVLETGGEAYMRTPQDDLPVLVRHSVDTYGVVLCALGVLIYTTWRAVCAAVAACNKRLHAHASKGKLE